MTVILLRHGVSTSNTARTLAGRSPGVELTERGTEQAAAVADRLAMLPIEHIASSPLLRCQRTVAPLAEKLGLEPEHDERLIEVDYGDWTGRPIAELLNEPLWRVVQGHASGAVFPGGEGLAQVQQRAVAGVRDIERTLAEKAGRDVLWVACAHGDVIKSILADALGLHLDSFQRIAVELGFDQRCPLRHARAVGVEVQRHRRRSFRAGRGRTDDTDTRWRGADGRERG